MDETFKQYAERITGKPVEEGVELERLRVSIRKLALDRKAKLDKEVSHNNRILSVTKGENE